MSAVTSSSEPRTWGDIQTLTGSQPAQKTKAPETGGLANANVFLQLLVTQLKNQNPLNPQDGTEFIAQLAQFSQLEQSLGMKEDLDAIRQTLESTANASAAQKP
jgi:flagellar basal-body rod modification protein FlgD